MSVGRGGVTFFGFGFGDGMGVCSSSLIRRGCPPPFGM